MKYINYFIIFTLVSVEALPHKQENESEFQVNGNYIQAKMETMAKFLELILQRLNMSTSLTTVNPNTVDCSEQCKEDDSCTSVFWSNSSDSNCEMNYDKHTIISFVPEKLYYCKDCRTTISTVLEGEDYGVIKLANVALNKNTNASSFANGESVPSNAIDGDTNTEFSTERFLSKGEQWFMVDLGERFLVAQIRIQVEDNMLSKKRGGSLKVCLTDDFERNVNPCNKDSEILTIKRRLSSSIEMFSATKVIMGRYIVMQKLKPNKVLEIVELEVHVVLPVMSYICAKCAEQENTTCYTSDLTSKCHCNEKNQFPIDGDAIHGCRDPCEAFSSENAVCIPVDIENYNCSCREGSYYPVEEDACNGCRDPCIGFEDRNSICNPIDAENYNCECKTGFYPIFDNPCFGCRDPCSSFKARNSICTPVDSENYNCDCKPGFHPIFKNACIGCKDPCFNITLKNAMCTSYDFENHKCLCNKGYFPIGGNPCNDCSNPCQSIKPGNASCTPIDFEKYECECNACHIPIAKTPCNGCIEECTKRGIIKSQNFPNTYPEDYSNNWIIRTSSGCQLKLTFKKFKTEGNRDVLTIRDGTTSSSNVVAELAGTINPNPIYSKNNGFYLQFSTDVSVQYGGFSILWEEVYQ